MLRFINQLTSCKIIRSIANLPAQAELSQIAHQYPTGIIELRLDALADLKQMQQVATQLASYSLPTLLTWRSKTEGGFGLLPETEQITHLYSLINHHTPTLCAIDLEINQPESKWQALHTALDSTYAKDCNQKIALIASWHDFDKACTKTQCISLIERAADLQADVCKLAFFIQELDELSELLPTIKQTQEKNGINVIISPFSADISMSVAARILAIQNGSIGCYASHAQALAPGQPNFVQMQTSLQATSM